MKKSIGPKTLVYPAPVFVVGSYDRNGRPNIMTAAWGGICCSRPPCVAVALRKSRYSYENIVARKAFSVNIPSEQHAAAIDFVGIVSGRKRDKFGATGLTAIQSGCVDAPLVKEFAFALECRLRQTVEIGVHTQFIGEIIDIQAEEDMLDAGGLPDIEKVKPLLFAPELQAYYGIGRFVAKAFSIGRSI